MDDKRLLLREYIEVKREGIDKYLTESELKQVQTGQATYLVGKIQCADQPNANGRVYPRAILEREMARYQELCLEKRATGELDHPDDPIVSLKNASHMMVDTWWQGDEVWGKLKVLTTPSGKILKALIDDGVKIGISSRGLGSLQEGGGYLEVGEDYTILCYDIVQEPSTNNAFVLAEQKKNMVASKSIRILQMMKNILSGGTNGC